MIKHGKMDRLSRRGTPDCLPPDNEAKVGAPLDDVLLLEPTSDAWS